MRDAAIAYTRDKRATTVLEKSHRRNGMRFERRADLISLIPCAGGPRPPHTRASFQDRKLEFCPVLSEALSQYVKKFRPPWNFRLCL